MTSPRPPTAQGISALLKRAGFEKSERTPGVRNWGRSGGSYSNGYLVTLDHAQADRVRVRHREMPVTAMTPGIRDYRLAGYAKAIRDAGWSVNPGEYELVVTAPKEAGQ